MGLEACACVQTSKSRPSANATEINLAYPSGHVAIATLHHPGARPHPPHQKIARRI